MESSFVGDVISALRKYAESSEEMIWLVTSEDFTVLEVSKRFFELTGHDGKQQIELRDLLTEQSALSIGKFKIETKNLTLDFKGGNEIDFSIKCFFEPIEKGFIIFGEKYSITGDELLMSMTKLNNDLSSALRELDRKNKELEDAKKKIKVLSGLLPVCSYCKKIRNDDESWTQLESYIDKHSEAEFSHTICPTCMDKYFPE